MRSHRQSDASVRADGAARWFLEDEDDFDAEALEAAMRERRDAAYRELASIDAA